MADLIQRYGDRILGVVSCYDRVIVLGRIVGFSYAKGMEGYLRARGIRLFDFPQFAMPSSPIASQTNWFEQVAFDNNRHNFVLWKDVEDLRRKLTARIEGLAIAKSPHTSPGSSGSSASPWESCA